MRVHVSEKVLPAVKAAQARIEADAGVSLTLPIEEEQGDAVVIVRGAVAACQTAKNAIDYVYLTHLDQEE